MLTEVKTLPVAETGLAVVVDAADYERLKRHRWLRAANGRVFRYSVRAGRYRCVWLTHSVLEVPAGARVRFENGNPLDCRRANLICATGTISYDPKSFPRKPWRVVFSIDGHLFHVGRWPSERIAGEMRRVVTPVVGALRGRGLAHDAIQRALDEAAGRALNGSRAPRPIERRRLTA